MYSRLASAVPCIMAVGVRVATTYDTRPVARGGEPAVPGWRFPVDELFE
jgi:hypothetical protein